MHSFIGFARGVSGCLRSCVRLSVCVSSSPVASFLVSFLFFPCAVTRSTFVLSVACLQGSWMDHGQRGGIERKHVSS